MLGVQTRANAQLTAKNAELDASVRREAERFQLAMDAIKLFHGEVSEDLLLKEKPFEKLRAKLLHGAADFYGKLEGLLKDQRDNASRAALGNVVRRAGQADRRDRKQARGAGGAPQGTDGAARAGGASRGLPPKRCSTCRGA